MQQQQDQRHQNLPKKMMAKSEWHLEKAGRKGWILPRAWPAVRPATGYPFPLVAALTGEAQENLQPYDAGQSPVCVDSGSSV